MTDPWSAARRQSKNWISIMAAKQAQREGKKIVIATLDLQGTIGLCAKHGALCEVIGDMYVRPYFRKEAL